MSNADRFKTYAEGQGRRRPRVVEHALREPSPHAWIYVGDESLTVTTVEAAVLILGLRRFIADATGEDANTAESSVVEAKAPTNIQSIRHDEPRDSIAIYDDLSELRATKREAERKLRDARAVIAELHGERARIASSASTITHQIRAARETVEAEERAVAQVEKSLGFLTALAEGRAQS